MALQTKTALFLDSTKDVVIDSTNGSLTFDNTVQTRALIRLLTRRGQYWNDANFGSRWWTINSIDDAKRNVLPMAIEALEPLIGAGEIELVELIGLQSTPNGIKAHISISVPHEELVEIANLPIGRLS